MTPEQAITILDQITSQAMLNRQAHIQAGQAVTLLQKIINNQKKSLEEKLAQETLEKKPENPII